MKDIERGYLLFIISLFISAICTFVGFFLLDADVPQVGSEGSIGGLLIIFVLLWLVGAIFITTGLWVFTGIGKMKENYKSKENSPFHIFSETVRDLEYQHIPYQKPKGEGYSPEQYEVFYVPVPKDIWKTPRPTPEEVKKLSCKTREEIHQRLEGRPILESPSPWWENERDRHLCAPSFFAVRTVNHKQLHPPDQGNRNRFAAKMALQKEDKEKKDDTGNTGP